mgnify:CR=1 FL=1
MSFLEFLDDIQWGQEVIEKITNQCPNRSPLAIVEALKPYIEGKVVCDVGCREGDMLVLFSKYAREVIGIEINVEQVEICHSKGLNVICGDMYKEIPKADVYYVWISKNINLSVLGTIRNSTVILGGDPSAGETYDVCGEKLTVYYYEGDEPRQSGIFELTIVNK